MSIAVSTSTAVRFAEHAHFEFCSHPARNLIVHTPGKWRITDPTKCRAFLTLVIGATLGDDLRVRS